MFNIELFLYTNENNASTMVKAPFCWYCLLKLNRRRLMKLKEIAQEAIKLLKEAGNDGINNAELAATIGTPKRRVYDVIAILKAADLIRTERSGAGTHLYWVSTENPSSDIENEFQKLVASRIKVSTSGSIYNVANRGQSVVIELDDRAELNIEPLID